MVEAYERLHALGVAHSVETWVDDKLVGGLYFVSLGKAVFGRIHVCTCDRRLENCTGCIGVHCKSAGRAVDRLSTKHQTPGILRCGGKYHAKHSVADVQPFQASRTLNGFLNPYTRGSYCPR